MEEGEEYKGLIISTDNGKDHKQIEQKLNISFL